MSDQSVQPLTSSIRHARNACLIGYFSLLIYLPMWIYYLSPPSLLSANSTLLFWWGPMLLPIVGLIKNNPFTYAWSGFLAVFYISQSITTMFSSETEQFYALIELVLASSWFVGASLFSRWRGQQLGLELPKRK
jgi:uncharacterized membrane protein